MIGKWIAFVLSAGVLVSIVSAPACLRRRRQEDAARQDHGEGEQAQRDHPEGNAQPGQLQEVPEGCRKNAKELVKLAKEAKRQGCAQEGQGRGRPQKKWDELMDDFIKTSEKLGEVAGKTDARLRRRQGGLRRREEVLHRLPQGLPGRRREFLSTIQDDPAAAAQERSVRAGRVDLPRS